MTDMIRMLLAQDTLTNCEMAWLLEHIEDVLKVFEEDKEKE